MSNTVFNTLLVLNHGSSAASKQRLRNNLENREEEKQFREESPPKQEIVVEYVKEDREAVFSVPHGETKVVSSSLTAPDIRGDIALQTPTFSIPSPIHPPGISLLDLSEPPELPTKLPAPVQIVGGNVRNLGKFTRNGKKRGPSAGKFGLVGEITLPSLSPMIPSKRQRTDALDLSTKLKSPISKDCMLPQDTPPFPPAKPPKEPVPEIQQVEKVEAEDQKPTSSTAAPTPISVPAPKQSAGNGSGSSCHQCKSRCHLNSLILCKNFPSLKGKGKRQGCRKKYCDRCLNKFYNENAPTPEQESKWACPACRAICRCAACRRQKAKHQNGSLGGLPTSR
uniref:Zinc-finger domain-containing protein n=1 Tax=Amorphochlora amoebiformis TaxID=1561963 RepID=A0A7S0D5E2_9EUKA|mmetsp:Transcript_18433/g.29389  ORF Transcript_18433/g.29389 Transcript_18433/m.29389 type:complete len:338 (+) Transcript_18433:59-1072(+)